MNANANAKTKALINALPSTLELNGPILVVGCGTGAEAGELARKTGQEVVGIDLGGQFAFDHEGSAPAQLLQMDAQNLRFADGSFRLVYSFHALEHMASPRAALAEMARVLAPGGTFVIGTPNANRIVGYIGSTARLSDKVLWNLADWGARLTGRWSNEKGAHAGFKRDELRRLCEEAFGHVFDVTSAYYDRLYGGRTSALLQAPVFGELTVPCVYMAGRKVT